MIYNPENWIMFLVEGWRPLNGGGQGLQIFKGEG